MDLRDAALRYNKAIGHPEKPSWLSGWRLGQQPVSSAAGLSAERKRQASRFTDALRELFCVAVDLRAERLKDPSIQAEDVTPVIIADELHELLIEVALPVGGKRVFQQFGVATYCPDNKVQVFAAAGGSYDLVEAMDSLAKLSEPRAAVCSSSDPAPWSASGWHRSASTPPRWTPFWTPVAPACVTWRPF